MPAPKSKIKLGVFIPGEVQLLDLACVDVLHMMSKEYLSVIPMLPKHIVGIAPSVDIFYITITNTNTSSSPSSQTPTQNPNQDGSNLLVPLSAKATLRATHTLSAPEVQPGNLDILLVPGPEPSATWEKPVLDFLRAHAESPGTDILSICTGIFLCGAAGLLDNGRTACGPRGLQDVVRAKHPGAKLVGEKYRWIQDGNFWSSGGITNGNDLVAAYTRTGKHFPSAVVEIACKMADVGDREQVYSEGQSAFTFRFVWLLLKGWFSPRR
ncbi:ThiJ/PfpI family protein [Xylariaceae sp. FL0255]|nr:ThiJ/PfpI family protein [Xylariaceae sp. FL0255]